MFIRGKKKWIAIVTIVMMCVALFGACTSPPAQEATEETPAASEDTAPAEEAPAEETPAATETEAPDTAASDVEYKLAWYVPAPHPTFDANLIGVQKFMDETGIEVKTQIGPDWEQANETSNVEAMIAMGYEHFAICPADSGSVDALFKELKDENKTLINFCIPALDTSSADIVIATDVAEAARVATEELIKALGEKGNIIHVVEQLSDSNTVLRMEAVKETVAKYPDVQIIQEIADLATEEESTRKINDALAANIDKVDGIISTGFVTTIGMCNVLSDYYAKDDAKKIVAIGNDYDDLIIGAIKDGTLTGTIAQNPQGQSYISCHIMKLFTEGWTVREDGKNINAGALYVDMNNIDTFEDGVQEITDGIFADLQTKYLEKK
jgi:ribose transport system substrate-binding protein